MSPRFWPLLASILILAAAPVSLLAQPPAPAAPAKEAPDENFYQVPADDDVEALSQFIVKLLSYEAKSRQDLIRHQQQLVPALRKAAGRILKLEKDPQSKNYKIAQSMLLQIDIQEMRQDRQVNAKPIVDRALEFVKQAGKDAAGFEVELLMLLGESLEGASEQREKLAARVYTEGAAILKQAADPRVSDYADLLAGMGRRLNLVGNTFKAEGTTHGGEEFDIADLRGKVVLVDFWATWCGPCLAEIPNMLASYERFHEAGFEIVGISLDKDRERLDAFLETRKLPWIIVHEKESDGSHPAAVYYGIRGIPAMFLVDRDGVVISSEARGPELVRLLEEQFPEVVAKEAKEAAQDAKPPAKSDAK